MLRRALELDGLSTLQRASLLGELAIELIFERDIKGRRQVLAEQELLLPALPIEERGWLMRNPGAFRYAGFLSSRCVTGRRGWTHCPAGLESIDTPDGQSCCSGCG